MSGLRQVGIDVEVNRMVEQHRLAFSESANDILRRILPLVPAAAGPASGGARDAPSDAPDTRAPDTRVPDTRAPDTRVPGTRAPGTRTPDTRVPGTRVPGTRTPGTRTPATRTPGTRTRGQWTVEIHGRRIPAANLKAAYRTLLLALSECVPDFLPRFAEEKGRSRRFVARTPGALYAASPHLAKKHAEPLVDGWYFDSNLSADQVSRRSRIAARLCGRRYGADVRILENLREI